VLIEQWRREYNQIRPHSALGYRPPAPEAIMLICSPKTGQKTLRFWKMLKYLEKEHIYEEIAVYRRANSFCSKAG
jgi:hypothetical protein